jgi:hypothetical protein
VQHDSEPLVFPVDAPPPRFRLGVSEDGSYFRQQDGHEFSELSEGAENETSGAAGTVDDTDNATSELDGRRPVRAAVILGTAHMHIPVSSQLQGPDPESISAFLSFPKIE